MFYASLKGTFTANYSMRCDRAQLCYYQVQPNAPSAPIGMTTTDGIQVVEAFNIVTDGLLYWSTDFWLPKSSTNYYLIAIFNGIPGEFLPTLTQVTLQV
jgi:hypothetical protein